MSEVGSAVFAAPKVKRQKLEGNRLKESPRESLSLTSENLNILNPNFSVLGLSPSHEDSGGDSGFHELPISSNLNPSPLACQHQTKRAATESQRLERNNSPSASERHNSFSQCLKSLNGQDPASPHNNELSVTKSKFLQSPNCKRLEARKQEGHFLSNATDCAGQQNGLMENQYVLATCEKRPKELHSASSDNRVVSHLCDRSTDKARPIRASRSSIDIPTTDSDSLGGSPERPKSRSSSRQNSVSDSDEGDSSVSDLSGFSDFSDMSGQEWKPNMGPIAWVQSQMSLGADPRSIVNELVPKGTSIPEHLDNLTLWRIIVNILSQPPKREKLCQVNTLEDVIGLIQKSKKIIVLTGAGVSVSSGIPDFRSRDGIYSRLSKDFPDLPDPQAMFDIHYFRKDPRPFFKFAKEIYPGQFLPSVSHRFIRLLEEREKLLRNYSQNIDTLETLAGVRQVIHCHGSFATATCTTCQFKVEAQAIKEDIFKQRIPTCPQCQPTKSASHASLEGQHSQEPDESLTSENVPESVMKPDIVFFGEGLSEEFHKAMGQDKDQCDLLIVMGTSLKVRPVALIPNSIPGSVPQVLINRETLPHLNFDVELLGDCDIIVEEICRRLGETWDKICTSKISLEQVEMIPGKYSSTDPKMASHLPADSFFYVSPSRYVFSGAEMLLDDQDLTPSCSPWSQPSSESGETSKGHQGLPKIDTSF